MPHRIHKCANTLYDYAVINYVSLMYDLKKNGKVFTSKSVGTVPSSCEKRIYRTAVSQTLRNTGQQGVYVLFLVMLRVPDSTGAYSFLKS